MALGIDVVKDDLDTLFVEVTLSDLAVGSRYDVFRLTLQYLGDDDDTGEPIYERQIPDRAGLWRAVAHRVGWEATAATHTFRDFEVSFAPTVYYVCLSSAGGPHEYSTWETPYPVSRGVLDDEVVHFERDLKLAVEGPDVTAQGHVLIRSTAELNKYISLCVVDLDEMKYSARGTEHAVLGSQFPVYVADSREARRGSVIVLTRDAGEFSDLRDIVFPTTGVIWPIIINGVGENTLLLDDLVCVPLDISVEMVTQRDAALRYVHLDFVEIDPRGPLTKRTGDNDALVDKPIANFTITGPNSKGYYTLTDTSTGQYDSWDWTIERGRETDNKTSKMHGPGPYKVKWSTRGKKTVKLRVYGSGAGAHTRIKTVTVT